MIDLDDFLPGVTPYAPGCLDPVAFAGLIRSAQNFCERTRLWRGSDTFNVTPTSCNVMCAPDGADVYEIEYASLNGYPLTAISLADLDAELPGWRTLEPSQARYLTQSHPDTVTVVPRTTGSLAVSLILRPSNGAKALPDFLFKHYSTVICDGALAEILMMPNQPFYAPDRAQFYSSRFETRVSELFNRSVQGQQRGRARTRPQFF